MKTDVVIIGAGASGLMCAIEAGKRGRSVLVLDHSEKAAGKILRFRGRTVQLLEQDYGTGKLHFAKSPVRHVRPFAIYSIGFSIHGGKPWDQVP